MLVRIIDVPEERRAEDTEREEEAEGEAEEDGGEDGVGDDHSVHIPAATLLLEFSAIRRIVLESMRIRTIWIFKKLKLKYCGKASFSFFF